MLTGEHFLPQLNFATPGTPLLARLDGVGPLKTSRVERPAYYSLGRLQSSSTSALSDDAMLLPLYRWQVVFICAKEFPRTLSALRCRELQRANASIPATGASQERALLPLTQFPPPGLPPLL